MLEIKFEIKIEFLEKYLTKLNTAKKVLWLGIFCHFQNEMSS
jgi:hypothetical protein